MQNELVPSEFHLAQNYPNPFADKTTIKYCLPHKCRVVLTVQDANGRKVKRLVDEEKLAGTYECTWDATNLHPGIYTCRMVAGLFSDTKRMTLMVNENEQAP